MGKKITGDVQPNGHVPWIYTDHGDTWVGVDYAHPGLRSSSYKIERRHGMIYIKSDLGEQMSIPDYLVPLLIKALKKK